MPIALIDGDIIRYKIGFACQKTDYRIFLKEEEHFGYVASYRKKKDAVEWINGDTDYYLVPEVTTDPIQNCLHSVKVYINTILSNTNCESYCIYLSGPTNFREDIATILPYKGNRVDFEKPVLFDRITEYLILNYTCSISDNCEADDDIASEYVKLKEHNPIICSIDKDLDQIAGMHYNLDKQSIYEVSEKEAVKNFYKQLLTGDRVDNVLGIPGIGPVKATKLLEDCSTEEECYKVCETQYKRSFKELYKKYLIETANLLWLRRHTKDEWKPPNEREKRDTD